MFLTSLIGLGPPITFFRESIFDSKPLSHYDFHLSVNLFKKWWPLLVFLIRNFRGYLNIQIKEAQNDYSANVSWVWMVELQTSALIVMLPNNLFFFYLSFKMKPRITFRRIWVKIIKYPLDLLNTVSTPKNSVLLSNIHEDFRQKPLILSTLKHPGDTVSLGKN